MRPDSQEMSKRPEINLKVYRQNEIYFTDAKGRNLISIGVNTYNLVDTITV